MATIAWVVMKHHKKSDGTFNVKIRITHNRTTAYMSTEIYTDMVRFKKGSSSGIITDGNIEDEVNSKIKSIRKTLNSFPDIISSLETAKDVLTFLQQRENTSKDIDFFEFADTFINNSTKAGTNNIRKTSLNTFARFLGERKLPLNLFTGKLIKSFDTWLRTKNGDSYKPASNTSIRIYMSTLKTIFYRALDEYNDYDTGNIIISNNPFRSYKLPRESVAPKRAVSIETIRLIRDYKSSKKKNRRTTLSRDLFMLSFYMAGINVADLYECPPINSNGRLEYNRVKTREHKKDKAFTSILVIPEALEIINKYKDPDNKRLLRLYKDYKKKAYVNTIINDGLHHVCDELGIPRICHYAARHSFATIARNDCNVSKDDVALCLTHKSGIKITDTYIKPDFSKIDEVVRKVVALL